MEKADKVNELEKKVARLEKVVDQLVARETNKQREFESNEEFERIRDEESSQIGHDMLAAIVILMVVALALATNG